MLSVSDRGPGIPAGDRARVVERFVRLEQSRSQPGSGIGLSLVSAVARLHGGELKLEDNAPGLDRDNRPAARRSPAGGVTVIAGGQRLKRRAARLPRAGALADAPAAPRACCMARGDRADRRRQALRT